MFYQSFLTHRLNTSNALHRDSRRRLCRGVDFDPPAPGESDRRKVSARGLCRTEHDLGDVARRHAGAGDRGVFSVVVPEDWRKLALVTNGYTGRVLREVTPFTAASHQTQCSLQDTYMRYGGAVRGVISEPTESIVLHGYRAAPRWEADYEQAGYYGRSHWLLTEQYQLCLTGLIGKLFRNAGDDDSGDRYQGEYLQMRRQLILNAQNMDGRS